jgi:Mg-chelatase subunit ChlD
MFRRTILRLLPVLAVFLASALTHGAASLQGTLEVHIDELNDSGLPVLRAAVTVTDAAGRPVAGLQAGQFQASAGGAALTVSEVQNAANNDVPMGLVLAFDVSGSMQGPALEQAREAGRALIEQLLPIDQVAVLTFAGGVQVVQAFTADRTVLLQAIDGLKAGGDTALFEAVARSSELAAGSSLPRRAVVLLSDGEDFGGRSTVDRAASLETLRRTGVPVFVVGLGGQIDRPYLEELAAAARTPLMLAPSPEELSALYSRIGETLRQQYLVTIDAGGTPPGQATLILAVTHEGVTASDAAPFVVPAPVVALATAVPTAAPVVAPVTEPAAESAPVGVLAAAGAVVVAAVGVAVALLLRRRRRRRQQAEAGLDRRVQSLPPVEAAGEASATDEGEETVVAPAVAQLVLLNGAGGQQSYPLGAAPATVGFTADCTVRLPGSQPHSRETVRVWRREGKFMVHRLSRRGRVAVGGRPVTWAVLEDGDEIEIGPCRLRFRLEPASAGVPPFLKGRDE